MKGGEKVAVFNLRDMPDDLHTALKIRAAELKTTMHSLALRYIEEGLKRDEKAKRGRK
jgi:plasmid stability protein